MSPDPITTLVAEIKKLKEECTRWKNIAGIMHEALQEGDCESAKSYYEEQCTPWR